MAKDELLVEDAELKDIVQDKSTENVDLENPTEDVVVIDNPKIVIFTDKNINIICLLSIFGLFIGFSFLSSSISQLDNECYVIHYNITEEDSDESSVMNVIVGLSIAMCVCILTLSVVGIIETLIHCTSLHCNVDRVMIIRIFLALIGWIVIVAILVIPTIMFITSIEVSDCIYTFSTFSIMYLAIALSFNLGTLLVICIIIMCIYPKECIKVIETY